ncbi:hypothetical protein CDL60_27235 [Roseateles noduli]|nr:hypothetical protein CDL60_27235 [Roseateles noduli]
MYPVHLAIRTSGRRIGTLSRDPARDLFDFVYDEDWFRSEDNFPLSPRTPSLLDAMAARLRHRCELLARHASLIPQVSPEDLL